MNDKERKQFSKYLSLHLRHRPDRLKLTLEPGGWVLVTDLLNACEQDGKTITAEQLSEIVAKCDKQRFAFNETSDKIRANQGHSVEVDLQLTPVTPPPLLYHGTSTGNLESILKHGIQKRARHHVHLSKDTETATRVGMRHGKVIVLSITTGTMHEDGYQFYCSANGVWLVDEVPATYINVIENYQELPR